MLNLWLKRCLLQQRAVMEMTYGKTIKFLKILCDFFLCNFLSISNVYFSRVNFVDDNVVSQSKVGHT